MFTAEQKQSLADLAICLVDAYECGLLDAMNGRLHPDTINTFCDAVEELAQEHCPAPAV